MAICWGSCLSVRIFLAKGTRREVGKRALVTPIKNTAWSLLEVIFNDNFSFAEHAENVISKSKAGQRDRYSGSWFYRHHQPDCEIALRLMRETTYGVRGARQGGTRGYRDPIRAKPEVVRTLAFRRVPEAPMSIVACILPWRYGNAAFF